MERWNDKFSLVKTRKYVISNNGVVDTCTRSQRFFLSEGARVMQSWKDSLPKTLRKEVGIIKYEHVHYQTSTDRLWGLNLMSYI